MLAAFARGRSPRTATGDEVFDGVRVDASGGLGPETAAVVAAVARAGLEPLVAFPIAGAGDAGYSREGELVLDARVAEVLAGLRDEFGARFAFLADPAAVISRCQSAPQRVWDRARRELAGRGVAIVGLATSFCRAPAPAYERLWVYGLRQGSPWRFDVDFASAFRCREWNAPVSPGSDALPDFCRAGIDRLERVRYLGDRKLEEPVYSRSFQCVLDSAPEVGLEASCEAIVYTDDGGWRLLDGEVRESAAARRLATDEVLELIEASAERGAAVRLVVDPADLEPPAGGGDVTPRRIRRLPYPYHYFIGLNSDVDWSTHAQVEAQAEELCDRLGLEMAGSAYPFSPTPTWVSWAGRGRPPERPASAAAARLPRWASEGLLDTLHGLTSTFATVRFQRAGDADEADATEASPAGHEVVHYRPERPVRAADHDGILVTARCSPGAEPRPPDLLALTRNGDRVNLAAPRAQRSGDLAHFHYDLRPAAGEEAIERLDLRGPAPLTESLVDVSTTFATVASVERLLRYLRRVNARLPVFTSHGGGEGSRSLAACVTEAYGERRNEAAAMSMDSPGTPYHVLPALARFGVFFFNPIGWFGTKEPGDIGELLRADRNRDGSRSYIFRRFCSRRYEEDGGSPTWAHGKLTSSAQGLAANLEDLLQRFHWLEPGHGCILYTHLGHGVGNRVNDRLGWTEELHAAWERVAEFVHGRDRARPVPFRLWHAPASRILAFALVSAELDRHLRVAGNEIHISSWHDEVLGLELPDAARYGASWLHGVTFYVEDPQAAAVYVDGRRMPYLTLNPADETGRKSVSLVDGDNLVPLVHGPGSLLGSLPEGVKVSSPADGPPGVEVRGERQLELPISPVSLRNATHWAFRLAWGEPGAERQGERGLRVGLRLEDGSLFTAGTSGSGTADWLLTPGPAGEPRSHAFALDSPAGRGAGRPRGRVTGLVISQIGEARASFEEIGLVRPLPVGRPAAGRIVAGTLRNAAGEPVERSVRLVSAELEKEARSGADGFYLLDGLPERCRFELVVEGALHAERGWSVYTSSDHWDWDVVVGVPRSGDGAAT